MAGPSDASGGLFIAKNKKEEPNMEEKKDTIRVVLCEPGRLARTVEIGTELADLQKAVGGGLIETYYPFEEEVCIVCNDEGKFNGIFL